ncbi:hypothetical protein DH2020_020783 [Rehmannia glutinosa]|uniref:Uncharacterized protein n=1 Tax=Rehmannia glutinosa TaxID=99300 RepID=A0ABR0W8G6_REHGL
MGCFLGCFGGEKDHKRSKRRIKRASPQVQRNRVQNVQQESVTTAEQIITETPTTNLVSELLNNKPTGEEQQLSPSPRKRVTFNSNITTYEHVSIQESIDSLPEECNEIVGRENEDDSKRTSPTYSPSEDDSSVVSSVGSYPPNHRTEEHPSANDEEVESFRDKNDHFNSVLKPIENIAQWKAAKTKGTHLLNSKSDRAKYENQEIAVDASLSNWLVSSKVMRT